MKHAALFAVLALTACGPDTYTLPDAGTIEDAGYTDALTGCCECLVLVDVAGEPCAEDVETCVASLEEGELPGPDRCGVGGRPYCSEECGEVWPGG